LRDCPMVWKALVVEKAAKAAKDSSRCALMGFIYALKLAGIVSLEGARLQMMCPVSSNGNSYVYQATSLNTRLDRNGYQKPFHTRR
jgi:hypothetical protein